MFLDACVSICCLVGVYQQNKLSGNTFSRSGLTKNIFAAISTTAQHFGEYSGKIYDPTSFTTFLGKLLVECLEDLPLRIFASFLCINYKGRTDFLAEFQQTLLSKFTNKFETEDLDSLKVKIIN